MNRLAAIDFERAFQNWKRGRRHGAGHDFILLDLGHNSIRALYARIGKAGEVAVLDYASSRNTGYADGAIVDQKQFAATMDRVIGVVRSRNRLRTKNVHVTFTAPFVSYYNHFATVNLPSRRRVTHRLVDEVINSARKEISSLVEHVIQVVPVRYALDSIYSGSEPPLGMGGSQLGVEMMFVTAPCASLNQIERSIKDSGYGVAGWWYGGISAAESVIVPSSEAGVAVADIGAGATDVSVYQHGRLLHVGVIERGGRDIDSDLAVYLNESMSVAEEVKRLFGCALPGIIEYNEVIDLRQKGFASNKLVSAKGVAAVIRNRAQELLYSIDEEIGKALSRDQVSRVILTGGSSSLTGFADLAEAVLNRKIELGAPCAVNGTVMGFTDPSCAGLIGTLRILRRNVMSRGQLEQAAMTAPQRMRSWIGALVSTPIAEQREMS